MTKLLFVDNGIEFDSLLLRKKPYGGAEVAFVSLVESLAKLNYDVCVYNNCRNKGLINGVSWNRLNSKINKEKLSDEMQDFFDMYTEEEEVREIRQSKIKKK